MVKQLKILVIEDEEKNAKTVKREFEATRDKLKEWELLDKMHLQEVELSIEWLQGTDRVTKRGKDYLFYTEQILGEIEKKLKKKTNGRIGILLDVVLTREEQERCNVNDVSRIELSKKIYDRFEKKCNLYLITGLRSFGTLAWGIFGREDVKNRYIPRELVADYPSHMAIAQALYWLNNREEISVELLRTIEDKELAE